MEIVEMLKKMLSSYLLYFLPFLALLLMSATASYLFPKEEKGKTIRIPGPLSLPIIGHLHLLLKKPIHCTLAQISARYGPILLLRLGPCPALVISSTSLAEECLITNKNIFTNRPRFLPGNYVGYQAMMLGLKAPNEECWHSIGTRIQMLYNHRINQVRSVLLRRLFKNGGEFKTVNVKSVLSDLTFNLMTLLVAGKWCYGDSFEDLENERRFRGIAMERLDVSGIPNIGGFQQMFRWAIGRITGWEKKLLNFHERRMGFQLEFIECQRMARTYTRPSDEKPNSLVDALLSMQEIEPDNYTDQIIVGVILNLLTVGIDNPASTMEWAMTQLLNNPEVLKKAQAEIDAVVGHGRLVDDSDLCNLPFLHCIINEILRMYPNGSLLAPRESSEECIIGGYTIPRGTMLLLNKWAMQHNSNKWEEPHKFKPERMEGEGFRVMSFGSSERKACPAEILAIRMIGLTLGSLIQSYEWERLGEEMVDLDETGGHLVRKSNPLKARCRPRSTMLALLSQP